MSLSRLGKIIAHMLHIPHWHSSCLTKEKKGRLSAYSWSTLRKMILLVLQSKSNTEIAAEINCMLCYNLTHGSLVWLVPNNSTCGFHFVVGGGLVWFFFGWFLTPLNLAQYLTLKANSHICLPKLQNSC